MVLNKYAFTRKVLGEGTSSICYLGSDTTTGEEVAIKVYKNRKVGSAGGILGRFKRQVSNLLELNKPFERPTNRGRWSQELAGAEPSDLFVRLLDFSRDARGQPGQDPADGSMYIITELAEHTLKSELRRRAHLSDPLPAEDVRKIARDIVLAVAGMHAKGFVHLDIKPENIMKCKGRWKIIDMDGCVRAGTTVKMNDTSVSFSPCYCAPEFAHFVINGGSVVVTPGLDVWSVGMTIAELVNLTPLLRRRYQDISEGHPREEASVHFLKWLAALPTAPIPGRGWAADRDLRKLLSSRLLVPDRSHRASLEETLSAEYFAPRAV